MSSWTKHKKIGHRCEMPYNGFLFSVFQIRIHWVRTRHFRLNTDPDPGFWWPKIWKNLQLKKLDIFLSKIAIYLSLGLHKWGPSYRRSLQPSKENIQHFKTWHFLTFFYFCGSFLPFWIRIQSGFRIRIPNLDSLTWLNPDPIWFRNTGFFKVPIWTFSRQLAVTAERNPGIRTTESYLMNGLAVRPDYPDVNVKEAALRHLEHQTHLRSRLHLWKEQLFNNFLQFWGSGMFIPDPHQRI